MRRTAVVVGGTVTGLAMLAGPAAAQEVTAESVQANVDIIFIMVCAAFVMLMHPGFALLEAGLGRAKNSAHIIMKNIMTLTLGLVTYYVMGFALMYGTQVGGFIGTDGFFLQGLASYEPVTGGSLSADFLFQAVFAATAATIISGACAERMKFGPYMATVVFITGVLYPIVGAWKWGGGWLAELGFLDFAGSTVVHMTGGIAALVGAAVLGPRLGKYGPDGKPRAILGHSMPLAMLGAFLLFFGWFGFNGGSVLIADGAVVADVLVNTVLAGAIGGVAAAVTTRLRFGKYDVGMTGNGMLAGLVGVTAGADVLNPFGSLAVGLIAGVIVSFVVGLVDRKVDDPVGAVAVHGACGALGTLWVGLAHTSEGLLYGGGASLLGVQALGVAAVAAFVGLASAAFFLALKATVGLRVTETEEIEGLDLHEHGSYGYPELALGPMAYPAGPRSDHSGVVGAPVTSATPMRAQAVLQE